MRSFVVLGIVLRRSGVVLRRWTPPGLMTLAACVTPTPDLATVSADPPAAIPTSPAELSSDACVPFEGDPTHCCPSRLGLDTDLVRDRCGFAEYLGERSELSCVHRFRDRGGRTIELRVTPIVGLTLARALELHDAGFVDLEVDRDVWPVGEEGGEITSTAHRARHWAFVPGWPQARRVSWLADECADESMLAVLRAMSDAPVDPAGAIALPELEVDLEAPVELAGLLLDSTPIARDVARLRLPDDAPVFAQAVIERAAEDDLAGFAGLLAPEARWGLPDRRQLGGRPIGTTNEQVRPSFVALRRAAARLTDATLRCPEPDRRSRSALVRGEHLQWCSWISADGLDVLVLALRSVEGHARLEYLGVFPQRPSELMSTVGEPPPPPLVPTVAVVCGDPHHHDPERCPEHGEPEPGEPEPEAQPNQRPASTMR